MPTIRLVRAALPLALALFTLPLAAGEWSRFRGPNGSGLSNATGLPVEVGAGKNMAWATAVPFGRSSPVLDGDTLFVTSHDHADGGWPPFDGLLKELYVRTKSKLYDFYVEVKRPPADSRASEASAGAP